MEGRPPQGPDDELDFDFGSSGRRPPQRGDGERAAPDPDRGGERSYETGERRYETSEQPYDTGERRYETGERSHDTGEGPYEAGERRQEASESPYETGERRYETTGERAYDTSEDPFDTGERRARREREKRRRGLRLPTRRRSKQRGRRARPAAADAGRQEPRDDPYTPAEVPVSGTRRSRHRDLPAKVRRRQAGLVGGAALVVVAAVVVGASVLIGGGGSDEEQPLGAKRLVGQTIIAKMGKDGPDKALLRRARKGQIAGVIATAPDEGTLTQQVARLQQAAEAGENPELLVLVDQEGGEVKRLPGPPDQGAPELGQAGADAARSSGEATGNYLKGFGVNVDLAPVLDVAVPQSADSIASRSFGDDPAVVSEVGSAFIGGLQGAGVAATAKHFPGLGPATLNTDDSPVTIAARDEILEAALQPFQAAVDAGVELVMVGSAIYPGYGPENPRDPNRPASSVKAIVSGLLRGQLGFEGVCVTDDLQSVAVETLTTSASAGVAALGAGCDLLLYAGSARGSEDGFKAVLRALKKQRLTRAQLQASYDRVTALKQRLSASSG